MTALSALSKLHQKGLFGNYQNKNESELIKVSEIKNIKIIQVVHYKKSNVKIASIDLDNLKFPEESMLSNSNNETRILWNAPNNWIVVSNNENILNNIKKKCDDKNFAVTDLSHSRIVIELKGKNIKEILKKGCPINFNEFKLNNCTNSVFHGITITIDMIRDNPETFRIFSLRSFGESLYHSVTDACLEDGYKVM